MRYVYLAAIGLLSIVLTVNLLSPGRPGASGSPPPQAPDASAEKAVEKTPPAQAPDKDPRVCTHCICGCTETGKCDCKDCDHPRLAAEKKASTKRTSEADACCSAWDRSLSTGKPLVLWVGGLACPWCEEGCPECLHVHVSQYPLKDGDDSPRCYVCRPDGKGEMDRLATLKGAMSCDRIKAALAPRATATASGCPAGACGVAGQCGVGGCQAGSSCASCGAGMGYGGQPAYGYGAPMMFMGGGDGGGGCASGNCGGSGGGRGRRR